jgi:hypothetical protein
MKRTSVILVAIFAVLFLMSSCTVKRYSIVSEMKDKVITAKKTKRIEVNFKAYEFWPIRPLISRTEDLSPSAEQKIANEKFFQIAKEELRNSGFTVINGQTDQADQHIGIEIGFNFSRGIPLLKLASVASRWRVDFKKISIFEVVDFKLQGPFTMGFDEEVARQLAKDLSSLYKEEAEKD